MRIAFLTHQWPGARLGGIGTYTSLCAQALARAGHEAHVFTFPLPDDVRTHLAFSAPPGLTVHEVPGFAARVAEKHLPPIAAAAIHAGGEASYRLGHACLLTAALREAHAESPFDVVEAPEFEALALPLILEPIPNLAVITHLHSGSAINRLGNRQPLTDQELALDALECAVILGADALCAPTRKVGEITEQVLGISSPPLTAAIIPIPITPLADADPTPPAEGPILFIARLERLKGADTLAKAIPAFLEACPKATVRILGPDTPTAPGGSSGASMRRWMTEQWPEGMRSRVEFLGERSRTDIASELAACSFVIIPSLYESFSLVCAEAMAVGRTAIVTRDIGTAEVIGDAGVLFPREDSVSLAHEMIGLYQNRERLKKLNIVALKRARDYLAESVVVPQRITFYQDAVRRVREKNIPQAVIASTSTALVDGPADVWSRRFARMPQPQALSLLGTLASVTAFLAGSPLSLTPTPGSRLMRVLAKIGATTGHPVEFYLYGAGRHTAKLLAERHLWESHGHRCVGLLDDHPRYAPAANAASGGAPAMAWGLPILGRAALEKKTAHGEVSYPVILSTDTMEEQFWGQTKELRGHGVRVFRLYGG